MRFLKHPWAVAVGALVAGLALCGAGGTWLFAAQTVRLRLQREVARQQGWMAAAPQVEEAARRWYGTAGRETSTSTTAWVTQRFQRATAQAGLQVASFKPQQPLARRHTVRRPRRPAPTEVEAPVVLEATVVGGSAQLEAFWQSVARELPGARLEALTVTAQPQGMTCRLRLAVEVAK